MGSTWKRDTEKLKDAFFLLDNTGDVELYHAVVDIYGTCPSDASLELPSCEVICYGRHVVDRCKFRISPERLQVHYIMGCQYKSEESLKASLDSTRRLLRECKVLGVMQSLPKMVAPSIQLPKAVRSPDSPGLGGLDQGFYRWMLLCHWLANNEPYHGFASTIEFCPNHADYFESRSFSPWRECPVPPEFDALDYVTLAEDRNPAVGYWPETFESSDLKFPGVITASLGKPLNRVSMLVATKLIQRAPVRERRDWSRKPHRIPGGGMFKPLNDHEQRILDLLSAHHGCWGGSECFDHMPQKEIAEKLKLRQPDASKAMGLLMKRLHGEKGKNGMAKYKALCSSGIIVGTLEWLQNPQSRERLTDDLESAAAESQLSKYRQARRDEAASIQEGDQ